MNRVLTWFRGLFDQDLKVDRDTPGVYGDYVRWQESGETITPMTPEFGFDPDAKILNEYASEIMAESIDEGCGGSQSIWYNTDWYNVRLVGIYLFLEVK